MGIAVYLDGAGGCGNDGAAAMQFPCFSIEFSPPRVQRRAPWSGVAVHLSRTPRRQYHTF